MFSVMHCSKLLLKSNHALSLIVCARNLRTPPLLSCAIEMLGWKDHPVQRLSIEIHVGWTEQPELLLQLHPVTSADIVHELHNRFQSCCSSSIICADHLHLSRALCVQDANPQVGPRHYDEIPSSEYKSTFVGKDVPCEYEKSGEDERKSLYRSSAEYKSTFVGKDVPRKDETICLMDERMCFIRMRGMPCEKKDLFREYETGVPCGCKDVPCVYATGVLHKYEMHMLCECKDVPCTGMCKGGRGLQHTINGMLFFLQLDSCLVSDKMMR
eukprot:scaffold273942_cov23-Tisochrysis_lutea.AAC.1